MAQTATAIDLDSFDVKALTIDEGYGVKGLSDMNLKTLPKQFIQPPEERFTEHTLILEESIPVIDISNWNDPKVADIVCDAAEKWGFFQIINLGIPAEILQSVMDATHRFFELPPKEKMKYNKKNSPTTNVFLRTSFVPEIETAMEWHDKLTFLYVSDEEAQSFWPPICRNQVLDYIKPCELLAKRLLGMLMKRLNVTEIDKSKESMLMGSKKVNLNYYPKCPEPELTIGIGCHSDLSTISILPQDVIGGLYVRKLENDSWIYVSPIDGALVINIGDALEIISNGRYRSIEHCVTVNKHHNRISAPFFAGPEPSAIIGPLEEVLESSGEKPLYKKVLYSDYAAHFFTKAHGGKDKIQFAII
nr:feruloyl CoA ortho-hydroxylase 2-like [Coffea arabica]